MTMELTVNFSNPQVTRQPDNTDRVTATVQLICEQTSEAFTFIAPIGLLEADELRWYLERYHTWPVGLFKKRAEDIEANFSQWGKQLLSAITSEALAQTIFQQWLNQPSKLERLLSLNVQAENSTASFIAASHLLSFPWELLHYGDHYLLAQQPAIQIRRNIPNANPAKPIQIQDDKIRILAISPRPSQAGWFDHRVSIKPLVEAVASLGNQFELVRIQPTFSALQQALHQAKTADKPFHILHFDGHGVFDVEVGKGALCFEHELDNDNILPQFTKLIYADDLAQLLTEHHIPLVFLEACQTAQTDTDPNASVATALLQAGVSSVIAMTHSVLIETARRFVGQFYQQLALGKSISTAVMAGQKNLMQSTDRINILGAGKLHLQDWFVPVLYQQTDSQLIQNSPSIKPTDSAQTLPLGDLPETPNHHFIGRSPELFKLERLLQKQQYVLIRGMGGVGKTTIAVELARWLVQSQQFDCCAFISLEEYAHDRAVLDVLGRQLVDKNYSVAEYSDLQQAMLPVQEVLKNQSCLLVLDNMESLLADSDNIQPVLQLAHELLANDDKTRLIFTSRESLPAPFNHQEQQVVLSELSEDDAKQLIMNVMAEQGLKLKRNDQGETPEEVNALIEAVNGHARALVLLARELSIQGVVATTENLQEIMVKLDKEHKGGRELSLFASVELSLQRLSVETQELIKGFCVLYDGGIISVISYILEIKPEEARQLCTTLIKIGLAQKKPYTYYRLDPALANYLNVHLKPLKKQHYQQRWEEIMTQWVDFLYNQRSQDAKMASQLTQLALPNLMAYIVRLEKKMQEKQVEPKVVTSMTGKIELLLKFLNYPQVMADVVKIRQQASLQLEKWGSAHFNTETQDINHLLSKGELQAAHQKTLQLLQQVEQAGDTAYAGASYNIAVANLLLGQVLRKNGYTTKALSYLQQAQQHFDILMEQGEQMASVSLTEQGNCLQILGQLDQAVEAYKEGIRRSKKLGDTRGVAVKKGQLASTQMRQKKYNNALQSYQESLQLFQQLNELSSIATIHHQLGIMYEEQSLFEQAEDSYRQALSIKTQQGNQAGEASSLGQLGLLYKHWNRPEQAVDYFRQTIDIYIELGNKAGEGRQRNNLADVLLQLKHLDEARSELLKAIKCKKPYGYVAELWKTWYLLHNLELVAGNLVAAQEAQQKAINAFIVYRRDGGENYEEEGRLALMVLKAIQKNNTTEIKQVIKQDACKEDKNYLRNLQAILNGDRNLALAEDNEMNYKQVVELKILLEQLQKTGH